ncbi:MAG: phosphate acyltransferase PlsX [Clostridia bacterium]|nr:phosphate acyltransferase PlsX [Clostridia bacterium]
MKRYKIAIDVMGNDSAPEVLIKGAVDALELNPDLDLALFGDEAIINKVLSESGADRERVEVVGTTQVITNYDNPMEAIFTKSDSSLVKALIALSERDDILGLINGGSTGALIGGALRYNPAKTPTRPALAATLPSENGGFTCIVDMGANIDCTPSQLLGFARQGTDFMKRFYSIENPRVGLLSNGSEETKGNKLVKETHKLLKEAQDLNFIGNIEGNRALSGDCDVLVADGFAGNQVFKCSEGIARRLITDIVKYAKKTGSKEIMGLVAHLMAVYDFSALGGGVLLGVGKPVIKARGECSSDSIKNTSSMLLNMLKNQHLFEGRDTRNGN